MSPASFCRQPFTRFPVAVSMLPNRFAVFTVARRVRLVSVLAVGMLVACSSEREGVTSPVAAVPALALAPLGTPLSANLVAAATAPTKPRTYRLGFSPAAPRPDGPLMISTIQAWRPRADAGILQHEVPWDLLLNNGSATTHVRTHILPLVTYYRSLGLPVTISIDVTNPVARDQEAAALVARRRSITESTVQSRYRAFVVAVAKETRPDYLFLALETNLVRAVAPRTVYTALVKMTNDAATSIRTAGVTTTKLGVSLQVESAWGLLPRTVLWTTTATYRAPTTDYTDFRFLQAIGLSSYPHMGGFRNPDDVPLDYYAKMRGPTALPVLLVEGGWTTQSGSYWYGSEAAQTGWIRRQAAVLDSARAAAAFHLAYTDLDAAAYPVTTVGADFAPFHSTGLVDGAFRPKPALAVWDSVHKRPYVP